MGVSHDFKTITSVVNGVQVNFDSAEIPGQRLVYGYIFPLVLLMTNASGSKLTLDEAANALRDLSERGITTELLTNHGCVILRGQPEASPHAMSVLVHAAEEGRGHRPYDQLGLAGSRTVMDKEVFSASEAPPHLWIYQHNEYNRYTRFPTNIHFFCYKAPPKGGESPFGRSDELYEAMVKELPEFVKEVEEKGLISPDVYRAPGKEGKNFIFTWAGELAFGRDIKPEDSMEVKKKKAEIQAAKLTPHFWWLEDDALEVHQHVPAVRRHPATKRPIWFNSLAGRYGTAYDRKANDPPYIGDDGMAYPPATYRDGTPIPKQYLHRTWELSQANAVLVKTQPGDLALVDNFLVTHGRAPWFEGERRILVSMWDSDKPEERVLDL